MRPAPQLQLGNYEALLQLATGGMATVYVARQIGAAGFERLVVVKRVHPHLLSNREFYDMFRDEARVAAMLHHPNVVPVTDVVEADGELFLVMEYIDSVALSTLEKAAADLGQRLPPAAAVRVMIDALSGLHAAHEAHDMRGNRLEIVHRDVSPQNIVVGIDGSSRIIDFGVAKARHRLTETKSGSLKGKYGYMSPEQ
ncbi:MAG: serine/threonine-protein kinase, partial [Polyangiaceae bacterium]